MDLQISKIGFVNYAGFLKTGNMESVCKQWSSNNNTYNYIANYVGSYNI